MVIAQQIKQKEKSYLKNLHNQFNLLFFFFWPVTGNVSAHEVSVENFD